ncbi:MAG: M48 family metalloprotease [Lysobacteraceae bacterium]
MRKTLISLGIAVAVCTAGWSLQPAAAQQGVRLPDMGSSAGSLITPAQEAQYGAMYLREMRRFGLVLDDPLVDSWLQSMGFALASATENSRGEYTFFMVRSRQVNAFATLGGYIGLNAGLVLAAESEDEVAAVMAHEIAHVTQRHIVRMVEQQQKDGPLIMLGMLAGLIAASQANSADGAQAAIAGGMGLMAQRQINHTRSAEQEADRLGIQTLARAGYDPTAMATFFGRMARLTRAGGGDGQVPEFLRTHPVTTTRMSEARDRAERIAAQTQPQARPMAAAHPLLPPGLAGLDWQDADPGRGRMYAFARERLRVLSATSPREAVAEYRRRESGGQALDSAERYGFALALTANGAAGEAVAILAELEAADPGNHWLRLAHAEALHRAGHRERASAHFEDLVRDLPNNLAVVLSYAQALNEAATAAAGRRSMELLRGLGRAAEGDYSYQRILARAAELAGDDIRAAESHAEVAFLTGRAGDALNQLRRLQSRDDLDYVQRARVEARVAAITPVWLEMERQGIGPDGRPRGG